MNVFARTAETAPCDQGAEHGRGHSLGLTDAGEHPWDVVMAALQTAGLEAAARTGDPFAALGLDRDDLPSRWADDIGGVRLTGVRHGRQVEIRIGLRERTWGGSAAMVTWIRAASADPHLDGDRQGRILPSLSPQRRIWSGLRVRGGSEGLVALRKLSSGAHSQGYLYDLWLLENLADRIGAVALPVQDLSDLDVPYRMG